MLVGAIVVTAAFGNGCATTSTFEARNRDDIEGALTDAGLTVCDRRLGDNDIPGAVDTQSLTVSATTCPTAFNERIGDDVGTTGVVQIVEYESRGARDAGARNVYLHDRLRPYSVATAYGTATIALAGGADGGVRERYATARDRLD